MQKHELGRSFLLPLSTQYVAYEVLVSFDIVKTLDMAYIQDPVHTGVVVTWLLRSCSNSTWCEQLAETLIVM